MGFGLLYGTLHSVRDKQLWLRAHRWHYVYGSSLFFSLGHSIMKYVNRLTKFRSISLVEIEDIKTLVSEPRVEKKHFSLLF